jgi:hypothetical protein
LASNEPFKPLTALGAILTHLEQTDREPLLGAIRLQVSRGNAGLEARNFCLADQASFPDIQGLDVPGIDGREQEVVSHSQFDSGGFQIQK